MAPPPPLRLHIGSGEVRLEGWLNVDLQPLPGVDIVADVTEGLRFSDVEAIYAEHFLEHLPLDDAVDFLLECHRALKEGGWIRLSTPNLDWVWATHYRLSQDPKEKFVSALVLNRAFYGWCHQFLWNKEFLEEVLLACGYREIRWCRYGESDLAVFRGIEHHRTYEDAPDLPHVLVVEAQKGPAQKKRLTELRSVLRRQFLDQRTL
jgi:predicted SAM-dependent methyltransferase